MIFHEGSQHSLAMSSSDDLDNLSDDYEYDPIPRVLKCKKEEQVKNRNYESYSDIDDNEHDSLQGEINQNVTRTKTPVKTKLYARHRVSNDPNVQARTNKDSVSTHRSRLEPDDSVNDTNFTKLQTDIKCSLETPRKTVRGRGKDKFKMKVKISHIGNTKVKSQLLGKNQNHTRQVKKYMGKQNVSKDKKSLHNEVVSEIKNSMSTLYDSDDEMSNDYVDIQSCIQDIVEDLPVLTDIVNKTADTCTSIRMESQKCAESIEKMDNGPEAYTEDFHGDSSSNTNDYFDGFFIGQSNNISEEQNNKADNKNITKFCESDDKKKYLCEHGNCNEAFTSQFKMYVHAKTVHRKGDKSALKCNICDRQFTFKAHLKHHMLIHKDDNQYECWVCQTNFKTPYYLKSHVKKVHKITDQAILDNFRDRISLKVKQEEKEESFKCEACEKVFPSRKQRQKHFLNVHNKKKQCNQCDKVFHSQSGLFKHKQTHSMVKPFECPHCQSRLGTIYSLQRHVKLKHGKTCPPINILTKQHTDDTDVTSDNNNQNLQTMAKSKKAGIVCEVCGKTLNSSSMREHMAIHTGEINFTCEHCGKGFYRMNGYKKHMRLHTGDKPYKCDQCFKSFRLRQSLSRHLTVHEGLKPFMCQICNRQFNRRSHLWSHTKTQHHGQGMPSQSKTSKALQVNKKINQGI